MRAGADGDDKTGHDSALEEWMRLEPTFQRRAEPGRGVPRLSTHLVGASAIPRAALFAGFRVIV